MVLDGTGDLEITLTSKEDLERAKPLFKQSYDQSLIGALVRRRAGSMDANSTAVREFLKTSSISTQKASVENS